VSPVAGPVAGSIPEPEHSDPRGPDPWGSGESGEPPAGGDGGDRASSRRSWTRAASVVVAVTIVSLAALLTFGSGEDAPATHDPDDPALRAYLEAVADIEQVRGEVVAELRTVLLGTYATRESWLAALGNAAEAMASEGLEARAAAIEPAEGYEASHDGWLESLEAGRDHLAAVMRAVERSDLLNAAVAVSSMEVDAMTVAVTAPPELCARLAIAAEPQVADVVCRAPDTLPGGSYGHRLHGEMLRIRAEVFPRIAMFPPSLTESETLGLLAVIQPDVERVFAEVLAEVETLDPPGSLREDHDAALGYLRAMGATAEQITAAARAGDAEALEELFARSAEPSQDLARRVSPVGRELLVPVLPPS
jgi:hypothetical protein